MKQTIKASQRKILTFIAQQTQENGYPPTIREIQAHCGYRSPRAVSFHLDKLFLQGYIERMATGRARTLRLTEIGHDAIGGEYRPVERASGPQRVPILGSIAAGFPALEEAASQSQATLEGELAQYHTERHFALKVRGESMIDAHILDGDIVIVEKRAAEKDEIVVALIDGEMTLKRLRSVHGKFYLQAENRAYPNLEPVEELSVQGVVVGVHRHL
ncbi:MAG: transcriptional repressor LexA [Verrucomicrobiota bacterium]|nr:transcriptional repressor LexA [Verrucomicrobiota bacterium]MDD8050977.1 transcriptional repressor LexA [Verrucomicrobiota bacterium]